MKGKNDTHSNASEKIKNLRNIALKIYFNESLIFILLLSLLYHGIGFFNLTFSYFDKNVSDLLLVVFSIVGVVPVVVSAVKALFKKNITVDLLASVALIFTIIQHEWVSAVFINLMLASARLFSAFTERKTENIISHLLKLRSLKVKIKKGDYTEEVGINDIKVGDIVVVESGERVSVDGVVIEGNASIDQSTLTGESEPVSKTVGSKVFSSTLCLSGSLFVTAEKVGEDTTLSKMIALVDEASREKTKTETVANKFSAWYISGTIICAVLVYIFTHNLNLVLSILLVTCADDLAVAIPLGFTVAISKAAKHGIVVKGSAVLERLKDIKIFVTDKTGTLTTGRASVKKVVLLGDIDEGKFLVVSALCAMDSKHPVAVSIMEYIKSKKVQVHSPDKVTEFPGEGIFAEYQGGEYWNGKVSFLEKNGVHISAKDKMQIREAWLGGGSINCIAINKKIVGFFVLVDTVKKYAKEAIAETREMGIKKWVMLSGDNEYVAEKVSKEVGLDEFHANLRPEDKIEYIKKIKKSGYDVAMIGDGVNDAASLALADVSFAMGAIGSDASIEAADFALMHDDLRRVPESIFLSKEVLRIVKQNFVIWAITNSTGLFLVFFGVLGPVGASAYNFITDFFPILNVFKIYGLKINRHTYDDEYKKEIKYSAGHLKIT